MDERDRHARVLTPMPGRTAAGQPRFWCRAGLVIGETSRRERHMLRDYVIDQLVTRRRAAAEA